MVVTVIDFSDWTDLLYGGNFVGDSNPATLEPAVDAVSASVYTEVDFSNNNDIILYARFRHVGSTIQSGDRSVIYFRVGDTYYIFGFYHIYYGTGAWYRRTGASRVDASTSAHVETSDIIQITGNEWWWVAISRDSGNIKYYIADGNLTTRPLLDDMTEIPAFRHSIGTPDISEIGITGNRTSGTNTYDLEFDDLTTLDDGGSLDELDLGTAKIVSIKTIHGGGSQGYARIIVSDPLLANYATIKANMKHTYKINENTYDQTFFVGELDSLSIIDENTLSLTFKNNSRKVRTQRCNYNQVLYSNYAKHVVDDALWDHVNPLPIDMDNKAVTMEKESLTTTTVYPDSIVEDHAPVSGNIYSLIYPNVLLDYGTSTAYAEDYTIFVFNVYVTDRAAISDLKLNLIYKILADSGGYNITPRWDVWYHLGSSWELLYELTDEETDGGNADVTIDISHLDLSPLDEGHGINDILDLVTAENDSGYTKYSLTIRFYSGKRNIILRNHRYAFDITELNIEMDGTDQDVVVGQGLIASSSAHNITFDNITPTWDIEDFPASEGYGAGDQYYITKWLDGIVADIFTNADTLFAYSQNITDIGNHVIFTEDLTYEYISMVLDKVKDILNAPWWLESSTNTITQESVDNFISTGIALTQDDFVGGIAGISFVINGSNIRSDATVIGKNETVTTTITEEYTLKGGDEEEIIIKSDLTNSLALNTELASLVKKHTNASVSLVGVLNYSSPKQSYANIGLYKTVTLTLADGDGNNIESYTDPKLTITKIEYNNSEATGFQDFVTIWLERLIA